MEQVREIITEDRIRKMFLQMRNRVKSRIQYKDCSIDKRWENYNNFRQWVLENFYEDEEMLALDKDTIVVNNTVYGPDTCCFIPVRLNNRIQRNVGGVYQRRLKNSIRYISKITTAHYKKYIGVFDTEEEARREFLEEKRNWYHIIADVYKERIPEKVYLALKER